MYKTIGFYILLSMPLQAASDKGLVNGDVQTNDKLNRMLAIPEVKSSYDKCIKNPVSNTDEAKISGCVWDSIKDNATLREKALKAMKDPVNNENGKVIGNSPISENFSTDPALQKLGDLITKKLDEALYGVADPKDPSKRADVDQKSFNKIYRAELNKTIIDAFMSYCLDTVTNTSGNTPVSVEADFKTRREQNIQDLKNKPIETLEPPKGLDSNGKPLQSKWAVCMGSVKDHCINSPDRVKDFQKNRACLVTQYVESIRKNITILDTTDVAFDGMKGSLSDANSGTRHTLDLKTTTLATVTSKEIETAYKDTTEAATKDLADCKNGSEEKCQQFINTKKEDNKKGLVEFNLEKNIQEKEFSDKVDAIKNKDDLKAFLLERGYKEEDVAKMKLDDYATIKGTISARYKNEKNALIEEMNAKVNGKTTLEDGKAKSQLNDTNLTKIQTELSSRTENMKNLVMFDNIVSGFLDGTVTGTGKKDVQGRNTASLAAELNNNDTNKDIKKVIEAAGTKTDSTASEDESNRTFDTKELLSPAEYKKEEAK